MGGAVSATMRIHPDMALTRLRHAMIEASLLDAEAMRDVLLRRGVVDTDLLAAPEWRDAIREAYRRLPKHLRPENA
jgi:hypothetical protein